MNNPKDTYDEFLRKRQEQMDRISEQIEKQVIPLWLFLLIYGTVFGVLFLMIRLLLWAAKGV